VKFNFNFAYDSTQLVADQLAATATVVALHDRGKLEIRATDGSREVPLILDFDGAELPEFFLVLHRFLRDVRVLEEWAGVTFTLPHTISREEMLAVAEAAYIVRERKSGTTFEQVTLELPEEQYKPFEKGVPGPLRVELPIRVTLFGTEIPLGRLVDHLEPSEVRIAHVEPVRGATPPRWLVRLEPATENARDREMRFERDPKTST
jgi:hypothetical protein